MTRRVRIRVTVRRPGATVRYGAATGPPAPSAELVAIAKKINALRVQSMAAPTLIRLSIDTYRANRDHGAFGLDMARDLPVTVLGIPVEIGWDLPPHAFEIVTDC